MPATTLTHQLGHGKPGCILLLALLAKSYSSQQRIPSTRRNENTQFVIPLAFWQLLTAMIFTILLCGMWGAPLLKYKQLDPEITEILTKQKSHFYLKPKYELLSSGRRVAGSGANRSSSVPYTLASTPISTNPVRASLLWLHRDVWLTRASCVLHGCLHF